MLANIIMPLASLAWLKVPILILFAIISVLVIFLVLIQKGGAGGLAGAFGGGDSGGVLGTRAGSFLSKITVYLGSAFLILALVYAIINATATS